RAVSLVDLVEARRLKPFTVDILIAPSLWLICICFEHCEMTTMLERRTNVTPIRPGLPTPQASPRLLTACDRVWVGPANPSLDSLLLRKIVLIHRRNLRSFAVGRGFALRGSAISAPSRFFLMMSSYSFPLFP